MGGYATQASAVGHHLGIFAIWAVGAYIVGYAMFVVSQRRFADEV